LRDKGRYGSRLASLVSRRRDRLATGIYRSVRAETQAWADVVRDNKVKIE